MRATSLYQRELLSGISLGYHGIIEDLLKFHGFDLRVKEVKKLDQFEEWSDQSYTYFGFNVLGGVLEKSSSEKSITNSLIIFISVVSFWKSLSFVKCYTYKIEFLFEIKVSNMKILEAQRNTKSKGPTRSLKEKPHLLKFHHYWCQEKYFLFFP
ncbi:hypothetical protein Fmac_028928 [Flemingia macrophylla]|uniref:Uncharacterized protein n=1 Tax=Flemingia macrophylla TaxID=520843 RepID=A0ABD1L8W5_9FABA